MKKILKNSAKCLSCGDIIESLHRHDFKYCKCKKIYVDGGKDYLKRGGDINSIQDMSEFEGDSDGKKI